MSVSSLRAVSMMIGRRSSRCSQRPAYRKAVEVGQGEVEQHDVDRVARRGQRVVTVRDMGDIEPFSLERSQQGLCDCDVILDEQDRCHWTLSVRLLERGG